MSDINGQESISVSFYSSLLGVGSGRSSEEESPYGDTRSARMSSVPSNYSTVNRLIDETDDRLGRTGEQEQSLSGLTRRLAEMFEQKQELVAELKNERIKSETMESERNDLRRQLDKLGTDYDQALAQVEQAKVARERATKFMEEAKEATRRVINESRSKVTDSEEARAEAERAYEDEHNLRRNLEQLLQEMRAESDAMTDKVTMLSGELRDMRLAKDETSRRLAEAEQDLQSLHAENEAHVSRIEHLTGRNELLARNLQSINLEHGELRKQFDATAVSHATLSADYEALMRRCTDAEAERDRLRVESIEHANFSAGEMESLKTELSKARNVIILLRPIIQKAGIGDLRKGDIRLLDARLTEYEDAMSYSGGDSADPLPQQEMPVSEPVSYQQYQAAPADQDGGSGYAPEEPGDIQGSPQDPSTTADLYEAFEMEIDDLGEDELQREDQPVEAVSFVDMFGKPQGGDQTEPSEYEFDEFDEFDDLDEPDEFGSYDKSQASSDTGSYDFRVADASSYANDSYANDSYADEPEPRDDFAFPQDLKRSDTQMTDDGVESDDDDDFGLENLSDFNAIMSDFAHYTAEAFEE